MNKTDPAGRIAIIGGGAAATLFLSNLADIAPDFPYAIDVFDRTGRFARGVAYSTHCLSHLLNVRASNMGALASDMHHFVNWAAGHGYKPTDFVPRKLYGDYLDACFQKAREKLHISTHRADIKGCVREGDAFRLTQHEGIYKAVIQATGNVNPLRPRQIQSGLKGYYDDPWQLDAKFLKSCKHVALIGSGLTAMDAILSLEDISFLGQITIISRHGAIPEVHAEPGKPWSIDEISIRGKSPLAVLHVLRSEIQKAAAQGTSWHSVLDGLRTHTNAIWQGFCPQQKSQFMRHAYTLWGVHRHRMAPQIGDKVRILIENGRLEFCKSRVSVLEAAPDSGINIRLENGEFIRADAAINCMGYRYAEPDRNFDGAMRLGPANFGDLFETTAIPEIRAQAFEISRVLLLQNNGGQGGI